MKMHGSINTYNLNTFLCACYTLAIYSLFFGGGASPMAWGNSRAEDQSHPQQQPKQQQWQRRILNPLYYKRTPIKF